MSSNGFIPLIAFFLQILFMRFFKTLYTWWIKSVPIPILGYGMPTRLQDLNVSFGWQFNRVFPEEAFLQGVGKCWLLIRARFAIKTLADVEHVLRLCHAPQENSSLKRTCKTCLNLSPAVLSYCHHSKSIAVYQSRWRRDTYSPNKLITKNACNSTS